MKVLASWEKDRPAKNAAGRPVIRCQAHRQREENY